MSIFEQVKPFPPDPIFGLVSRFKKDKTPGKVDLTVGVFRDEDLKTCTLRSVNEAEKVLMKLEKNKTYLPMEGSEAFIKESQQLIFGKNFCEAACATLSGIQSLGGTGALRLAAEFLFREVTQVAYISNPTWPNHFGVLETCGFEVRQYPYYDKENHTLDFEHLLNTLAQAPEKSLVVLHTCCHNPTGCDPTKAQWKELSTLIQRKNLVPLFDFAYQGFGLGLEEDAWPIRYFAQQGHEMFVAASYSKNFGLYGERIGSLSIIAKNKQLAQNASSFAKHLARVDYSTPPRHGAGIVTTILQDVGLSTLWRGELDRMRTRIEEMRNILSDALAKQFGKDAFGFLKRRCGMFSMLGLSKKQVERMINEYGIYLTQNGRVNLTGLSKENLTHVIEAMIKTMG